MSAAVVTLRARRTHHDRVEILHAINVLHRQIVASALHDLLNFCSQLVLLLGMASECPKHPGQSRRGSFVSGEKHGLQERRAE